MPNALQSASKRLLGWAAASFLAGLAFVPATAGAQTWQDTVGAERPHIASQLAATPAPSELTGAGQDWRADLEAERARNADRIRAIDEQATPLGRELNQVMASIKQHNDYPPAQPADPTNRDQVQRYNTMVDLYNKEAVRLNSRRTQLVNVLTPLATEYDRLVARNKVIDSQLKRACVQVPIECTSNADCTCSNSCGLMEGPLGNTKRCQAAPH